MIIFIQLPQFATASRRNFSRGRVRRNTDWRLVETVSEVLWAYMRYDTLAGAAFGQPLVKRKALTGIWPPDDRGITSVNVLTDADDAAYFKIITIFLRL